MRPPSVRGNRAHEEPWPVGRRSPSVAIGLPGKTVHIGVDTAPQEQMRPGTNWGTPTTNSVRHRYPYRLNGGDDASSRNGLQRALWTWPSAEVGDFSWLGDSALLDEWAPQWMGRCGNDDVGLLPGPCHDDVQKLGAGGEGFSFAAVVLVLLQQ